MKNQNSSDRYGAISRPKSAPSKEEDDKYNSSKEYANFLKDTERKCGPDGFLDSRRYTHAFELHKQKQSRSSKTGRTTPRLIDLSLTREKNEKEYKRRLKAIEDAMWQAKQEERHLERSKHDVTKKQRDVQQMMKSWEQSITKESFEEDKKLNKSLDKYTTLQRDYIHRKNDLTKKRADTLAAMIHEEKDTGRKAQLNTSHLSSQYRTKMDKLRRSKFEADRLVSEFEEKLRRKEMEQYELKKELEDLYNQCYREALKGKQAKDTVRSDLKRFHQNKINDDRAAEVKVETQMARGDGDVKAADMKKRRLSAQLSTTRSRFAIKKREEDRTLQSTCIKLDDNLTFQRELNVDAKNADYDRRIKEIQYKIEEANTRRINAATAKLHQQKKDNDFKENMYNERAQCRCLELKRQEYEDCLRHARRCVSYGEGVELRLHSKVKDAEYQRTKQEKEVGRLKQQLQNVRRTNSRHLTREIANANLCEKELTEQLIRAKSKLDKTQAQLSESYYSLQSHRSQLQEDRHLLKSYRSEDRRLSNIGQRSDSVLAH